VKESIRKPEEYGFKRCQPEDLRGADAGHNARELERVFTGEDQGAHRDALLMGTSLILEVVGLADDLRSGVEMASAAIDDGKAAAFLQNFEKHFAA
jgi:anthranilate phosphoribosyltransferase